MLIFNLYKIKYLVYLGIKKNTIKVVNFEKNNKYYGSRVGSVYLKYIIKIIIIIKMLKECSLRIKNITRPSTRSRWHLFIFFKSNFNQKLLP